MIVHSYGKQLQGSIGYIHFGVVSHYIHIIYNKIIHYIGYNIYIYDVDIMGYIVFNVSQYISIYPHYIYIISWL